MAYCSSVTSVTKSQCHVGLDITYSFTLLGGQCRNDDIAIVFLRILAEYRKTRKRGSCECIVTEQPDAAQSLSALISSPVLSLNSLSISVAVLDRFTTDRLRYAVTLNSDPVTLIFDLCPWTLFCIVCRLYHGQTLYQIWAQSSNSRQNYCSLNIWSSYDTEHIITSQLFLYSFRRRT